MKTLAKQKSPVKVKNYTYSYKYGRKDIVITKDTILTPSTSTFDYVSQDNVLSISSLTHVSADQLIAIKGHVAHLNAAKKMIIQGAEVKKQEGYINDPSGYIKIVFWGKHTDKQEEVQTYIFNEIRLRENYGQKYLNTPKRDDECTVDITEPFQEMLSKVEEVSTTEDITVLILGINNVSKNSTCASCQKKVTVIGKVASCNSCKMSQRKSLCPVHWSSNFLIRNRIILKRSSALTSSSNKW